MILQPEMLVHHRYRIMRLIGRGGMGEVYEAIDERLAKKVALKQTMVDKPELRQAFEREAHILAGLRHPALPVVIDHFLLDDGQFLVMDFIQGDDLADHLIQRGEPFSLEQVLEWGRQVLHALSYLHQQDPPVIHRDIKPQNLKLTPEGAIVLLDFGLAKGAANVSSFSSSSNSLVSTIGYTPQYAPLEQIEGSGTGPTSDLYALAATLYHLLTGTPPPNALKRANALMNERPDPLRPVYVVNSTIPLAVGQVLHQALALQPAKRPASAEAMLAALTEAQHTDAQHTDAQSFPSPIASQFRAWPDDEQKQISLAESGMEEEDSAERGAEEGVHLRELVYSSRRQDGQKKSPWLLLAMGGVILFALVLMLPPMFSPLADDLAATGLLDSVSPSAQDVPASAVRENVSGGDTISPLSPTIPSGTGEPTGPARKPYSVVPVLLLTRALSEDVSPSPSSSIQSSQSSALPPTDTPLPAPSNTSLPAPTDTPAPLPTDTPLPVLPRPTNTPVMLPRPANTATLVITSTVFPPVPPPPPPLSNE